MIVFGFSTYEYLRVSQLGLVLLAVLCLAGLIAVGFAAHRLLKDQFADHDRGGLTYAGYAVLAAILIGIVALLVANVETETPSQAADKLDPPSSSGNPFDSLDDNPFDSVGE